MKITEELS